MNNPRYSLRSFARTLAIDPSLLSKTLKGSAPLSSKSAAKVVSALGLEPQTASLFLDSVGEEAKLSRISKATPTDATPLADPEEEIDADRFRIISDWYHYAILELIYVPDFKNDPRWIASRLGISVIQARLAVERLCRLRFLTEESGKLTRANATVTTKNKSVTTPAFRRLQKQVLEMALESLENDPIDIRSHTSMTMAINPERIELARKLISEFNRYLNKALGSGRKKQVYHLGISLYPVEGRKSS